jgi:hypothetical protein
MSVWQNKVPGYLISAFILILVAEFFFPVPAVVKSINSELRTFGAICAAFAMLLGSANIVKVYGSRIMKRGSNWEYSVLLLAFLFATIGFGLMEGTKGTNFKWLYNNIQVPAAATVYGIIGFYVVFAAYRAFRARTLEAAILLVAGFLTLMWGSSIGHVIWPGIGEVVPWLVDVPSTAGFRGYAIAVAVATVAVGASLFLHKQALFQKAGASGEGAA